MRLLSFDGGPGAALYVRLLVAFEEEVPGFLSKATAVAGTSDGAFFAAYLVCKAFPSASDSKQHPDRGRAAMQAMVDYADDTFRAFAFGWRARLRFLSGLTPAYDSSYALDFLHRHLGDAVKTPLPQLDTDVVLMSARLRGGFDVRPLTSFEGNDRQDMPLQDAVLMSASLPGFLPIWNGHIDGGLGANNPGLGALLALGRSFQREATPPGALVLMTEYRGLSSALDHTHDLSFGAKEEKAQIASHFPRGPEPWGLLRWARALARPAALVRLAVGAQTREVTEACQALLGSRFRRVETRYDLTTFDRMKDLFLDRPELILQEADAAVRQWKASPAFADTVQWLQLKWMPDDDA